MKKNKMMRFASMLLVLTLLSTCAISGTFAKYTTENTSTDSARVAKWGVTITSKGDAFAKEYETTDTNVSTIAKSVVNTSTDNKNLVAPGTSGTFTTSVISGTPEVAVAITYEAIVDISGSWVGDENGTFYFPIVVKVGETEVTLAQDAIASAETWESAIKAAIEAKKANYAANTTLSEHDQEDLAVTWAWAFDADNGVNDAKDTYLGNVAAGLYTDKSYTTPEISISVKTTVTQVD